MTAKPTNSDLQNQIVQLDKKVERRHSTMLNAFTRFKKEIRKDLLPFHDFIVAQNAITEAKKSGAISINSEVWNIIKWLILIIGGLVGVKLL